MLDNHKPRQRFGQNFLHDQTVIDRIINALQLKPDDHVVEIGPGLGALTVPMLPLLKQLDVVEFDRSLVPKLQKKCEGLGELHIHQNDALKFDFMPLSQGAHSLRIVGNLPYNISTPLLFHLLDQAHIIKDMNFMLQKEVVERMAATADTEAYGRLSVMVQYHCKVQTLLHVKPGAFIPPPKVESAFVQLVPYKVLPHPAHNMTVFADVVRSAFNQRRKTLRNSLSQFISAEQLTALGIDPILRAEKLTVEDFVKIANRLESV